MPLNIKDSDQDKRDTIEKSEPILHQPREDNRVVKIIIIGLVVIVVLGAGVFLLYQANIIGDSTQSSQEAVSSESSPAVTTLPQPDTTRAASSVEKEKLESSVPPGTGRYTVYISSYPRREDADEEVGRWNEAGFQSFKSYSPEEP